MALPFQEDHFFDTTRPRVVAWEFTVPRGLLIHIPIDAEFSAYFFDLFRLETRNDTKQYVPVATKPQIEEWLEFSQRFQGRYLVHVQPELLERGGC